MFNWRSSAAGDPALWLSRRFSFTACPLFAALRLSLYRLYIFASVLVVVVAVVVGGSGE
jgi:hypothetical protein